MQAEAGARGCQARQGGAAARRGGGSRIMGRAGKMRIILYLEKMVVAVTLCAL